MGQGQRRRVLVTRAAGQGSALADQLAAHGLQPVLVPAIAFAEPTSFAALDRALDELGGFDWLVFTSANAVAAFAAREQGRLRHFRGRVTAIGAATAQALRSAGLDVDLIPPEAVAESLAAALRPFARGSGGAPARFLLPRAQDGRDVLADSLLAEGAQVVLAPAYRTVVPENSVAQLRALHAEAASLPDAITFTSSSSARNLVELYRAAAIPWPGAALRVSIGPVTTATLRELDLAPHAEAPAATVAALAETVARCLASGKGERPLDPA